MTRPATVVVDLDALRHNYRQVRHLAPGCRVMAVVKADAYGHGLTTMARALSTPGNGADAFGVACLEEAEALREVGIGQPIVVLEGPFERQEVPRLQQLGIGMVLHQAGQLEMLGGLLPSPPVTVWLKVDSGMHRLGFPPAEVAAIHRRLLAHPAVGEVRLMTHLACANDRDDDSVASQIECFEAAVRGLSGERSIANSAALLAYPRSHADWVRPGLALYGVSPFPGERGPASGLRPVMGLHSRLIAVHRLQAGDPVGYGAAWRCPEAMPVGVVAIGYGDGYPRHARSGTPVLVEGVRASLIGRPSMDMLTVDLRAVPGAGVGSPVTLWGEGLPVEEVAECADTIPYELLCAVGRRARIHVRGAEKE
ncbi:MAG: alanine racemase [Gammaproteobacteria bacterium]|nr:MAG: alanine racemase [Gammaproteobacteria bacterium]